MERYFGPHGMLAQKVADFEFRASQLEMAEAVFASLKDATPLIVEAGTGTGKTWAYLIPAILSGQKVILSTGTKNLQDQILDHDIPFLKEHLFPRLRAICLKGRKNYLCRRKFRLFAHQPSLWNRDEAKLFKRFQDWAMSTNSGDRAEVDWLPDDFRVWNQVSSSGEQCLGQQCPESSRCFISLLRQEAARSDLLIVNHHLYFADQALRSKGNTEILPEYSAVIFDEAHQLEDIICLYFGVEFGDAKIAELVQDIQREFGGQSRQIKDAQRVFGILQHLSILRDRFYQHFAQREGNRRRYPLDSKSMGQTLTDTCLEIVHSLEQLSACLSLVQENRPAFDSFVRRSSEMAYLLKQILEQPDPDLVFWYELSSHSALIRGVPIETSSIAGQFLFGRTARVVLTSATLSVAGTFDFLRRNLGIPAETRELLLSSPFVFARQALLFVPERLPLPQSPDFCDSVAREASKILIRTKGRALFLFTSYRNLNIVHRQLQDLLPYNILAQGEKPKRRLLAEFKQQIDSVLLATSSFWQGVDVPGEALSCLLIDKLPFEVPVDPLTAARMESLSQQGRNPFFEYQIPRAIIYLRQGVGRLIRSSSDKGVVVIFDLRLFTKAYGRLFLESLPPMGMSRKMNDISRFLSGQL